MAGLNDTPKGDRVHIAFFGLRNAGKSTLVNKLTGQDVAIVSDVVPDVLCRHSEVVLWNLLDV